MGQIRGADLSAVLVGADVSVTMSDGRSLSGAILSASADQVSVRSNGGVETVSFAEIKVMKAAVNDPISDGIVKGMLIGGVAAGTGMALFMANYGECPCSTTGTLVMAFGAMGAGVGALLGAVIDKAHHATQVVYRGSGSMTATVAPVFVKKGGGATMSIRW